MAAHNLYRIRQLGDCSRYSSHWKPALSGQKNFTRTAILTTTRMSVHASDYERARSAFPYFQLKEDGGIAFMENAGGSQVTWPRVDSQSLSSLLRASAST
jgi:hypothetical protein